MTDEQLDALITRMRDSDDVSKRHSIAHEMRGCMSDLSTALAASSARFDETDAAWVILVNQLTARIADLEARADAAVAAALEGAATRCDEFSWLLPMLDTPELNEASDDAACAVQEQIADAIRALITPAQADALAAHDKRVREAALREAANAVVLGDTFTSIQRRILALINAGGAA